MNATLLKIFQQMLYLLPLAFLLGAGSPFLPPDGLLMEMAGNDTYVCAEGAQNAVGLCSLMETATCAGMRARRNHWGSAVVFPTGAAGALGTWGSFWMNE
ncbi:MAG: hypothetical protein JRD04_02530 [Deltaproteobacteria bacterium]|nr:hypothetical protein [Deltaproteobacteria bacterium]